MESRPTKLVTLRDIASVCGLSVATVSLALSETGSLSAVTRQRVKETAARLGYVRNPLLGALALRRCSAHRKATLVPIVLLAIRTRLYQPARLCASTVERSGELGYFLRAECVDAGTVSWSNWARIQFSRGVVGILLDPVLDPAVFPSLPWERFVVVGAGRSILNPGLPWVSHDVFAGVLECYGHLRAAGCRRVGFVPLQHVPEHPDDEARHAACLLLRDRDPAARRIPVLRAPLGPASMWWGACRDWFLRYRPDGVVGFHPGVLSALRDAGAEVPSRVRFAALHVVEDEEANRGIAGMLDARRRVQIAAVELLDARIRHSRFGLEPLAPCQLVPPVWRPGETCGDIPVHPGNGGRGQAGVVDAADSHP